MKPMDTPPKPSATATKLPATPAKVDPSKAAAGTKPSPVTVGKAGEPANQTKTSQSKE